MGNKGIWQSLILDWDTSSIGYFLYAITLDITLKKTGSHNSISFRRVVFSVENYIKLLLCLYSKSGSINLYYLKELYKIKAPHPDMRFLQAEENIWTLATSAYPYDIF